MDSLSDRIKQVRSNMGMTQDELANMLRVHKNTLRRWESGQGQPDAYMAGEICKRFGVSPYWLLNGTGPMLEKDRDIKMHIEPGTKAGDLRQYKPSEISGSPELDATTAHLQARLTQLERERDEARVAELKAKDEALRAKDIALQTLQEQAARKQAEALQAIRSATTEELIEAVNAKGFTLEIDGKIYPKK